MYRLTGFELGKIWRKRSFVLSFCVLLILNVFLLWYTNLAKNETPALSSYRIFQQETAGMSETEKAHYISNLKETIDGVYLVQEILTMQSLSGEMGKALSKRAMQENPDVFEKYYGLYQSGDYLKLTNSLWQEKTFIDGLYAEQKKVAGYEKYLQSVQENKSTLSGISIFGNQDEKSFSARNIKKSAEDYAGLTKDNIRWMPQKALTDSMESTITDILLILSVFLFAGKLILEEKEKKLFYIVRSTKYGIFQCIISKLMALLIHCMAAAFLLYGTNLAFFGAATGFGDFTANIQSVAAYMESSLSVSIWGYILLSVITKGMVLFGIGAIITALCILAEKIFLPYFTGFLLCAASYLMYAAIPAVGAGAPFKYLNLAGLLKTENLYGAYLNFNLFAYPVSRFGLSWIVVILLIAAGVFASIFLFVHGENFELKSKRLRRFSRFRPHACLLKHVGYKIMIANRAAAVILIFALLIGYRVLNVQYKPSMQEQYYQDIMMQLEGELTEEKEELILSEQQRFDNAFAKIEQLDRMILEGELSEEAGENLKSEWYSITAFYSSFERVIQQYQRIGESGGRFIYDTGYLYLFGKIDQGFLTDLFLLSLCIILAFSNVMAMEFQSVSWNLIGATFRGKRKIIFRKVLVCVAAAAALSMIPLICRIIRIHAVYPLRGLNGFVRDIPYCRYFALPVSVGVFILLLLISQALSLTAVTIVVLWLSYWRKDNTQTIFSALLILAVPLILNLLGFVFAGRFSVYPLYSWTARLM